METHFDSTNTLGVHSAVRVTHPVDVDVVPALEHRNRLTALFRIILALPHLVLVGGPVAFAASFWAGHDGSRADLSAGGGVLGAVAVVVTIIAWFAIVFGARHPDGLWGLAAYYLRWRVRAVAYLTLLRDEYPPFGDGDYSATLVMSPPIRDRDRLTVAFRPILAIPQLIVTWILGVAWAITTVIALISILITGRYPAGLYRFAVGVLRWSTRVEAYVFLMRDEYPPFSLD